MARSRRIPRNLCAQLISIEWTEASGGSRIEVVGLNDISPGGARLRLEEPLEPGTPVNLYYSEGHYAGTVKYCLLENSGYSVGIAFDERTRWSRKEFRPSHMLSLREPVIH